MKAWTGSGLAAQLLRGGAGSLLARIVEVVLGLLVVVLLARLLGAAGYGVYAFVFALVSLVSVPARMGLPPLVVRETARGQRSGDWSGVRGVWRWANAVAMLLSLSLALAGGLVLWFGWLRGESLRETLFWGLGLIPVLALVSIRSASLRGLRHVLAGVFPERVVRPALLAGLLLLVFFWPGAALSPGEAMALTLGAGLVAFCLGVLLLRRYRPVEMIAAEPVYRHREWLMAAWPMALTQGFQQINRHVDVLLLGVLATTVDVGVYRVAAQGALLASLGLMALNMVVAPFAARLHAGDEIDKQQKLVRRTAQAALAFAVPATVLFAILGDWLLATLFGDEFRAAYWPLLVLAAGQVLSAWFGPVGVLLNMSGYEREVTRAVAVAAGINLLLNLLLIPLLGVVGAAIATTTSLSVWNVWLWLVARWRLGVSCSAF